ncbi:MAG TPA: exopolysaccharide transport family protein, partial [Propylenella sp.]|nr:exopolysaccharide transport family protein [Propylenella sp.]
LVLVGLKEHPADETIRQRVMDAYFDRLSVYPLATSRVIGVEFVAPDPILAAEVANAIADSFVELQQAAKRQSAIAATEWLQQEIVRLRTRVAEAEQAVAAYRTTHDLYDVDTAGNLSTQQLGDLNAELARAKAARSEAEARAALVEVLLAEGGALEASQEVLDSQLIQRLRERQVALQAQIAELSTTMLPGHPRIRSLTGQLQNLEGQIREEARKIQAALQTAARVAAAREQSLMESLNEAKVAASRSGGDEIELRALEREAAAQRDLLESFLGRYREALARTDANYLPADARIISRAIAPTEPSYPKKVMMAVAAALASLLIGTAFVMLREFTSGRAFRVVNYGLTLEPVRPAQQNTTIVMPAAQPEAIAVPIPVPVPTPYSESEREAATDSGAAAHADVSAEQSLGEDRMFAAAGRSTTDIDNRARPEPDAAWPAELTTETDLSAGEEPDIGGDSAALAHAEPADAPPEADAAAAEAAAERKGTAELADIIASPAVRLILFAGAVGGEGAGDIAFSAARQAATNDVRFVLMDVGRNPSEVLGGGEAPGLGDLLAGEAAFGEVIRRDEAARLHTISSGSPDRNPPLQRMQLVVGALTHTYDKVVIVADRLEDWPHDHVKPDLAAIVCGPDTTELSRTELYDTAIARGAKNVLIVRYAGDSDGHEERPPTELDHEHLAENDGSTDADESATPSEDASTDPAGFAKRA